MRNRSVRSFALLSAITITLAMNVSGQEPAPIEPDAQERIDKVARRLKQVHDKESAVVASMELFRLLTEADENDTAFIQQLVYYLASVAESDLVGPAGVIFHHLEFSNATLARALAPLLHSADEKVSRRADRLLAGVEAREEEQHFDFSLLTDTLNDSVDTERFRAAVVHMYNRSPGDGMLALARKFESAETQRTLLIAEHEITDCLWRQENGVFMAESDASRAHGHTQALAKMKPWWVRLFVADAARRCPACCTTETLHSLRADPHQLVREWVSSAPGQKVNR